MSARRQLRSPVNHCRTESGANTATQRDRARGRVRHQTRVLACHQCKADPAPPREPRRLLRAQAHPSSNGYLRLRDRPLARPRVAARHELDPRRHGVGERSKALSLGACARKRDGQWSRWPWGSGSWSGAWDGPVSNGNNVGLHGLVRRICCSPCHHHAFVKPAPAGVARIAARREDDGPHFGHGLVRVCAVVLAVTTTEFSRRAASNLAIRACPIIHGHELSVCRITTLECKAISTASERKAHKRKREGGWLRLFTFVSFPPP